MPGLLGSVYNRIICVHGGAFCECVCVCARVREREGDSRGDTCLRRYSYNCWPCAFLCSFPVTWKSPDLKGQALCSQWRQSVFPEVWWLRTEATCEWRGTGMELARDKEPPSRQNTVRSKKGREGTSAWVAAQTCSPGGGGEMRTQGRMRRETFVDSITDLRICTRVRSKLLLHMWVQTYLRSRVIHWKHLKKDFYVHPEPRGRSDFQLQWQERERERERNGWNVS